MDDSGIDTVVVATDGSRESGRAVGYAAALLRGRDARVLVVHVIPAPATPVAGTTQLTVEDEVELERTMAEGAQAILGRAIARFARMGLQAEGVVREGDPVDEILSLLRKEKGDLLVVGSHGAGRAERVVLGSVSDALVHSALCPVLVVKTGAAG